LKKFSWDKHVVTRTYRYGKCRQAKTWWRKKSSERKGFMRYSSGPKWSGQYDYEKPAFWRTWQPELKHQFREDELRASGYSKNQAWISLCKSWNGFLIAKRECDHADMRQYAGQIRKLQKDLGLEQTEFEGYSPAELANIDLENNEEFLMDRYGSTF
jgi:hypothetical protein